MPFVQHHDEWEGPDPIGSDPEAPLPTYTARPVDPGRRLAAIFDECWRSMAAKHQEWRGVRPSDRGMAVRYLKGTMLTQVDPDVAEQYVRSFAPAVAAGEVDVKDGQLPFMVFTRWWGTTEVNTDEPERKALAAWMIEESRRKRLTES